jgi:EAL domain-containing protein (putative c-di-GMP-specific phosphodiesterase class I)
MQFRRKGLIEMVRKALEDSGLPGERLELEVTESLLIDNRDDALRTLTALKELGVRIAMDDFGTGYSSLSYLQSFPFDKIKIDRAFVSDLEAESQNASIVRAVASMGKSLHMRVVAEGVETADQARLLKDLDCDELQGFLIARPMPAAKIEEFLEANHKVSMAPVQLNPELRRAASR